MDKHDGESAKRAGPHVAKPERCANNARQLMYVKQSKEGRPRVTRVKGKEQHSVKLGIEREVGRTWPVRKQMLHVNQHVFR